MTFDRVTHKMIVVVADISIDESGTSLWGHAVLGLLVVEHVVAVGTCHPIQQLILAQHRAVSTHGPVGQHGVRLDQVML